jgi:hypothetical protein
MSCIALFLAGLDLTNYKGSGAPLLPAMRLTGTSAGTLYRAVLLEALLAATIVAIGIACGPAALTSARWRRPTAAPVPGQAYYVTMAAGLAGSLLVTIASLPLLSRAPERRKCVSRGRDRRWRYGAEGTRVRRAGQPPLPPRSPEWRCRSRPVLSGRGRAASGGS